MRTRQTTFESEYLTSILVPYNADNDTRYRLEKYIRWMADTEQQWYKPDLAAFRDFLLECGGTKKQPLAAMTVRAHLSTVRVCYQDMLSNEKWRKNAENIPGQALKSTVESICRGIDPKTSRVRLPADQIKPAGPSLHLTPEQAIALIQTPGVDTLAGLRDTAILTMLLCLGLPEKELSELDVEDLHAGENGFSVRIQSKSMKLRLAPYGNMAPALWITERWLQAAGIEKGAVFHSFWRGGQRLRGQLQVRAIHLVVGRYPQFIDRRIITLTPGDLRRSSELLSHNDRFAAQLAATIKPAEFSHAAVRQNETQPTKPTSDWRV
ncbi:MAG: hypothetical protein JXA42_17235 [Anaerolineales bacterium]|nr:hypothetical protein [Anaerolineales bacterium]